MIMSPCGLTRSSARAPIHFLYFLPALRRHLWSITVSWAFSKMAGALWSSAQVVVVWKDIYVRRQWSIHHKKERRQQLATANSLFIPEALLESRVQEEQARIQQKRVFSPQKRRGIQKEYSRGTQKTHLSTNQGVSRRKL